jgi:hypothetical protein
LQAAVGGLLSAFAFLAIFTYQSLLSYVLHHGGTYPSAATIIAAWILLPFGAIFSYRGAQLLHNRLGLVVPIVDIAILAYAIYQFEWCLRYCVYPY